MKHYICVTSKNIRGMVEAADEKSAPDVFIEALETLGIKKDTIGQIVETIPCPTLDEDW